MSRDDPSRKWWRRGDGSRYHSYYRPTSNRQGQLLFGLLIVLGLVALGVAGLHWAHIAALAHDDKVLGGIGIGCIALGLWQIRALSR